MPAGGLQAQGRIGEGAEHLVPGRVHGRGEHLGYELAVAEALAGDGQEPTQLGRCSTHGGAPLGVVLTRPGLGQVWCRAPRTREIRSRPGARWSQEAMTVCGATPARRSRRSSRARTSRAWPWAQRAVPSSGRGRRGPAGPGRAGRRRAAGVRVLLGAGPVGVGALVGHRLLEHIVSPGELLFASDYHRSAIGHRGKALGDDGASVPGCGGGTAAHDRRGVVQRGHLH